MSLSLPTLLARLRGPVALCWIALAGCGPAAADATRIHHIQGAAHVSPMKGRTVHKVPGIVTATRANGFYMEDWQPDADPATSEGIFVFTDTAPRVQIGARVRVSGIVAEFRPGGDIGAASNLSITQIVQSEVETDNTGSVSLPPPAVLGAGGRMPPGRVFAAAADVDVERGGRFDTRRHGIDFFESLEGMRVVLHRAVAVGPKAGSINEVVVVADDGQHAAPRSARGGVIADAQDFNPERIFLSASLPKARRLPKLDVGDRLRQIAGIVDYSYGNFKLLLTSAPVVERGRLQREITGLHGGPAQLTVASFNVQNLDPSDSRAKFDRLARQIVQHLRSPDILALMEVQDASGAADDGVVDASSTLARLLDAIRAAGGPPYAHRQIDPQDTQDGGEPGGNIRQVLLFQPARVRFIDRPGAGSGTAASVLRGADGPRLNPSPGRVAPSDPAFTASRKPLAGQFMFNGHTLFLLANHFRSKGGDQPLAGRFQPPATPSQRQRVAQATAVARFVSALLAADANAKVVVLGDLNDFEFSQALQPFKAARLSNLTERLPPAERYTYVHEGNSQALDHILVSPRLASSAAPEYDIVHVNAEFAERASDHDPVIARFTLPAAARR